LILQEITHLHYQLAQLVCELLQLAAAAKLNVMMLVEVPQAPVVHMLRNLTLLRPDAQ
jgi:hypothetical protein